jgi:hypothetical protein
MPRRVIAHTDPIKIEQVDQLLDLIAANVKVKPVPGNRWAADHFNKAIMYPREEILAMPGNAARGHMWRQVEHLISSVTTFDAYTVAVDACLAVRDALGVDLVHPRWVMGLFFHAERERATQLARHHGRNIEARALPRRGADYRETEYATSILTVMREPTAEVQFWESVATAMEMLMEGTLSPAGLPPTMNWDPSIVQAILDLVHAPTYNELIASVERLVVPIAEQRFKDLSESSEDEENEPSDGETSGSTSDGDPTSDADEKSERPSEDDTDSADEENAEKNDGSDGGEAAEPDADTDGDEGSENNDADAKSKSKRQLSDAEKKRIKKEVESEKPGKTVIDFASENPNAPADDLKEHEFDIAKLDHDPATPSFSPSWGSVVRASRSITQTLRETFLRYIEENEVGDMAYSQRRGGLDVPVVTRPSTDRRPFKRRSIPDDHHYAIGIIVDVSGSMGCYASAPPYPEAFGAGPSLRWHLATRMTVALTEALSVLPGTDLAILTYDERIRYQKPITSKIDAVVKDRVMNAMGAFGDNADHLALKTMIDLLGASYADRKIIFHLTDGQFCSKVDEVHKEIARAQAVGVDVVILTLALSPDFAHQFVPKHMASEITDENLGSVLARHLSQMLWAA